MNKTTKTLTIGAAAIGVGLILGCSKDDNKVDNSMYNNPLGSDITEDSSDNIPEWNEESLELIVSDSVPTAELSVGVNGTYDPNVEVTVNNIATSAYSPEVIDPSMYNIKINLGTGKHVVDIKDNNETNAIYQHQKRIVTVKPNYAKDVFNSSTKLTNDATYGSDVKAATTKAVGVNKAMQMFNAAYSSLTPGAQTIITGIINDTDVHIKQSNLSQVVISDNNVYAGDKQGRFYVLDITAADVTAIKSKYTP